MVDTCHHWQYSPYTPSPQINVVTITMYIFLLLHWKRKKGLRKILIIIIKDLDSFKLKTAFSRHFGLNNKVSPKKGEVKVSLTHDGKIQFPSKYFCYQLLRFFEMCCQHWILTVSTDIDFLLNSLYSASKDLCSFSIISLDFLRSWNQGNATELRGRELKNKIGHTINFQIPRKENSLYHNKLKMIFTQWNRYSKAVRRTLVW